LGRAANTGPTSQGCKEFGRFAADHGQVFVLGGRGILGGRKLHDLALGNHGGGRGQDIERLERADLHHHLEGLSEQEVANKHTGLVAPYHPGGRLASAHFAFVDDIVMQERGRVHELDGGRKLGVPVTPIACQVRHRHRQHRTQPLAARADQVIGNLGNHRDLGTGSRQNRGVHPVHVRGDKVRQGID